MNKFSLFFGIKLYKNYIKKYYYYIIIRMSDLKIKGISYHERMPIAYENSEKYPDRIRIYIGGGIHRTMF